MITNFPSHLDEKVKVSFMQYSEEAIKQSVFSKMFNVSSSNDYSKGFTSTEWGDEVAYFGESEDLKEINNNEGYEVVSTSDEFGWKITLTKKEKLNAKDADTLFNVIVDEKVPLLMNRMRMFIERHAAEFFNDWFAGAIHLAPDSVAIFGTHIWNSTDTSFINRHATNIVAWEAALTALEAYAWDFKDANGLEFPINLNTLWVKKGGSADVAFRKVLAGDNKLQAATIGDVNIYNNGTYTLIATPYITSSTAWFAQDRTQDNSFVMDFIQDPMLEDRQTRENLTDVFPSSASFRYVPAKLPTDWYGSDGSGS